MAVSSEYMMQPLSLNGAGGNGHVQDLGRWSRVPAQLRTYRRWVVWKLVERTDKPGKFKKLPINPFTGIELKGWNEHRYWLTFDEAVRHQLAGRGDGIGLVFTGMDDGLIGIDVDGATTKHGEACELLNALDNLLHAPWEPSVSSTGRHYFVFAPGVATAIRNTGKGRKKFDGGKYGFTELELFVTSGFIAFTGDFNEHAPLIIPLSDAELFDFLKRYWPNLWPPVQQLVPQLRASPASPQPRIERTEPELLTDFDREVIELARTARNRSKFNRLFGPGDGSLFPLEDLRGCRPTRSETDYTLALIVVFWTCGEGGGGLDQAERIMRASGLVRAKWNTKTYLRRTLERAKERQANHGGFYKHRGPKRSYKRNSPVVQPKPPVPREQLANLMQRSVTEDESLPADVRETYKVLRSRNRGCAYCSPSQVWLAKTRGVSVRTINSHLRILREREVIVIGPKQRVNGKRSKNRMYWFLSYPPEYSCEPGSTIG